MEKRSRIVIIWTSMLVMILPRIISSENNVISLNYYQKTCPHAEDIIAKAVIRHPELAPGLIRLPFHDCFVNGCDASIMLDSTPTGKKVEKESGVNLPFLNGLNVIDEAKAELEAECPGVVSCADIIQYAARDSVAMSGLSHYDVPGGRRDGLVSLESDVGANMPLVTWDVQKMLELFKRKGLNEEDLVVLAGAHSVGSAHCPTFNYREKNKDPKLSPTLAEKIKATCDKPSFQEMLKGTLPFDLASPNQLDTGFYDQLIAGQGLLESDQVLNLDPRTANIVSKMASPKGRWKDEKFAKAMIKMSKIELKTGSQGEVRKQCTRVNFRSNTKLIT